MGNIYLAVDTKPYVRVWRFEDAPPEFQSLSTNGGDEDWLALIPQELARVDIPWTDQGHSFGLCDVSDYPLPSGAIVRIGSHG